MTAVFRWLAIFLLLPAAAVNLSPAQEMAGSSATPYFIRSWQVGQGLPSSTVNAITQTRDGYLWLGTDEGLARFDGLKCRVFGLQEGLKNLQVSALLEDRSGTLWIGTAGGGLGRLVNDKIQTFSIKDGLAGDSISALVQDAKGDVWIGTHTGLSRWHDGTFDVPDPTLSSAFIFDLAMDHEGRIWAATLHNGLMCYQDGKFSLMIPEKQKPPYLASNPRCLVIDNQDRVWAGLREQSLLCYDHGTVTRYGTNDGFPQVILNRLAQTQDGTIWGGSIDNGLFYFQNGQFHNLQKEDGLPDDSILALYADKDHLLWIGSQSGGLSRLGARKLSAYHVMNGADECVVRSLAMTTNGDLWVGTYGQGVYQWKGTEFIPARIDLWEENHLLVEALLGASDGSLWWGAGPHLYQTRQDHIISQYSEGWLTGDRVWCLGEAPGGGLWVGTFNGRLARLLPNGKFKSIKGLGGKPLTSLAVQPDGTLWIASLGDGLLRLQDGKLTAFTTKDGLGSDLIRTLMLDPDGVLWIGTDDGGLTRYANGEFKTVTTRQGLVGDTVLQILSDDDGNLWLGCNQGICRLSKRVFNDVAEGRGHSLHPLIIGTADGMPTEECVGFFGAALKVDNSQLCFSTARGIVVVDPRKQFTHITEPPVLMEGVSMDGQPLMPTDKTDGNGWPVYQATPGRHGFEFRYTGLTFDSPERIQFRYQLEGWDQDWVEAGDERVARYNIPPGNYRFRVIACNSGGLWNEVGAGMTLVVPPNLWQALWFKIVSGLILLGLLALLIRQVERGRYRARLRRLEQEHAMQNERARIARDLHDELGSSLTYISMSVSDLDPAAGGEPFKKRKDKISAFATRTARSLDEIVWAINPVNDSLRSLLAYLTQFAREHFEESGINCRFQIPDDLPEVPLPPEMRHNIFLAVKEALNNALKYARATEVLLAATSDGHQVVISVQDNGVGFDLGSASARQERNGLSNMRQRVEKLGGKFNLETAPGKGTVVRLTLHYPAPRGPETKT